MNIGGVDVSISSGDSIQQIATKVKNTLSASQIFNGRSVSIEGTGDNSKVKIVFGANENINATLPITTPPVAAPVSISAPTQSIIQPEIQAIPSVIDNGPDLTYITFDDHVTTPPLTINFPQPLNEADTVSYLLNDYATNPTRYAPYLVDRTVDLTNFLNGTGPVTVSFDKTVNNPLCTVTTSNGVSVNFDPIQQAVLSSKIEEFSFSVPNVAGDLNFTTINGLTNVAIPNAGTVSVDPTDTPQSIANKVQTQLQTIFPNRTITVNNDKVIMTYQASENAAPLVGITMTAKKPTTATATINSDSSIASILLQSLSISPKGEVVGTYSNGQAYNLGNIGIASFANDGGLKAIGNNRYAETGLSGAASLTLAGAPKAGNIMTGALEQANVDITNELMDMIRAQQVYNGNARMLQTTIETVGRITDKI